MADIIWIRIQTDMFDNRKIKIIQDMPKGDSMIVIWLKLLCLAGQTNDMGAIYLTPDIPYTEKTLATVIHRPIGLLRSALDTFQKLGMITISDGYIYINSWEQIGRAHV